MGIERAEKGGVAIERGVEVAQANGSGAVHRLAGGGELHGEFGDFALGVVAGDCVRLALEGDAVGLEGSPRQSVEVFGEAVEGLKVLAETARRLEKEGGALEGRELVF